MNIKITISNLNLYEKYAGDIDGLLRMNYGKENDVFGDDINETWFAISNKLQDIALISKCKVAQNYAHKVFDDLAESCDIESFDAFTSKIPFYANFQKIAAILQEIKDKIHAETDTIWAGFDTVESFLKELNQDIEDIRHCNFTTLQKIHIEFAPTGTYQELSMSNGWSEAYLKLAERFDTLYEAIKASSINSDPKKPWWKFFSKA